MLDTKSAAKYGPIYIQKKVLYLDWFYICFVVLYIVITNKFQGELTCYSRENGFK